MEVSPITWDEDIAPEGLSLQVNPAKSTRFTFLYFIMAENGPSTFTGQGVDMFLTQCQLQQKFNLLDAEASLTAGYQYVPYVSSYMTGNAGVTTYFSDPTNPPGAPLSITQKGMVGNLALGSLIPDIQLVEGILTVAYGLGDEKVPVLWTFHGAYNLNSFNITPLTAANVAVNNPSSNASNALAMFARLAVGKTVHPGDWAGSLEWGYIEPNAVFADFSDSDSGLGYNNNTWFKGKVEVGLVVGLSLSVAQYMDWKVNYDVLETSPSAALGSTSHSPIMRTQIDMSAKF